MESISSSSLQFQASQASVDQGRAARVLVVDDERHISRLFEYLLGKQGYGVKAAGSAEEAFRILENFQPDAILMDLELPGMSGLQAIQRMRADTRYASVPIMVLSAHSFEHLPEELSTAGVSFWWAKPIAPSTLVKKLEDCGITRWIQADGTAH